MAALGHVQLAEKIGLLWHFLLGLQLDAVLPLGIGSGSDEENLGTLEVEQPHVLACEAAATENSLQLVRMIRLFAPPRGQLLADIALLEDLG